MITGGSELIARERIRQISEEDYNDAHDDDHDRGELALAAVCYAAEAFSEEVFVKQPIVCSSTGRETHMFVDPWPWDEEFDRRPTSRLRKKPVNKRIELLVKAGALIAAEIDRLQRTKIRKRG